MTPPPRALALVALAAVLAVIPGAAAGGAGTGPTPILPLAEVRPGMEAVVLTVLDGDRIEELPARIVGVLENALGPGHSLILTKLTGERADFTGVAAGMSGSPVYVDGRLLGALAYRLGTFTKEAIGGVTPIEYMLDMGRIPAAGSRAADPGSAPARRFLSGSLSREAGGGASSGSIPLVLEGAAQSALAQALPSTASLLPIEAPLVVTGLPPDLLRHFTPQIEALGGVVVAGAGAGSSTGGSTSPRPVKPGDAIAAQLVKGDLSVAATGTVTHVDGDRVIAFGHAFGSQGTTEIPMARAEIYMTLASLAGSNKIARVLDTFGTWEQSRLPGVSGVTTRIPSMIPLTVKVRMPVREASYRYELARHRDWTPLLVAVSVAGSLINTSASSDEATLSVTARFRIEGHPDVVLGDLYTGFSRSSSAALATAGDLQGVAGAIFQNRFEDPRVTSIEVNAEGIEEGRIKTIEGVWPSKVEASPGEEVHYSVRLRSFQGEAETRTLTFKIPEGTPRGELTVMVGGASFFLAVERQVLTRRVFAAGSLDQIIGIVNQLRPDDAVYAKAIRRMPGAVVQSEVLPALPPSILTTLQSNRGGGEVAAMAEAVVWEGRLPVESIVTGGTVLRLKVR